MAAIGRQGRASATFLVGEHQHQESSLPRRPLCRGTDRARHGEHDYARDARGLSRSWPAARQPRRGRRRTRARSSRRWSASGISLNDVTDTLVEDGVTLFSDAFDSLLAAVDTGRRSELTIDARPAVLHHPAGSRRQGHGRRCRLAEVGQGTASVGARRHALDWRATKVAGWAGSASPTTSWRTSVR